jgi:hypothetical protein
MKASAVIRGFLAAVFTVALAGPLAIGCGDDDEGGADCSDSARSVDPGSLDFNAECCADGECSTGTCGHFNSKGDRCTKACAADADCAGLGEGKCGGQGVCAVPG